MSPSLNGPAKYGVIETVKGVERLAYRDAVGFIVNWREFERLVEEITSVATEEPSVAEPPDSAAKGETAPAPARLDAAPEGTPEGARRRHPGGRPVENNWAGATEYVERIFARYGRRYGRPPFLLKSNGEPHLARVVAPMERFFKKEPPPRPKPEHIYRWLRDHPQEKQRWFGSVKTSYDSGRFQY